MSSELELAQILQPGAITWPELLNERFDRNRVRDFSVHQTLHDLSIKKKVEIARNKFLLDGFDDIFAEIARRYGEAL